MHDLNPLPDIDNEITADEQYTCTDCGNDAVILYQAEQCANCAFEVDQRRARSEQEITTTQTKLHS